MHDAINRGNYILTMKCFLTLSLSTENNTCPNAYGENRVLLLAPLAQFMLVRSITAKEFLEFSEYVIVTININKRSILNTSECQSKDKKYRSIQITFKW